jgi:hypothetical protein
VNTRLRLVAPLLAVGLGAVVVQGDAAPPAPYPLDGYEQTGIRRLRAYAMLLDRRMPGNLRLPPGALLSRSEIRLRLLEVNDSLDVGPETPHDPELQAALEQIAETRDPSYRFAVLDITDPARPRYAAVKPTQGYTPGSVGKLLVMTALFHQLKKHYPDQLGDRARVLRETMVPADQWAMPNSHAVPVVADDWSSVTHRAVRIGDVFSLWEWVDHMVSPSSNAAGTMVWKQVILLDQFGRRYPVTGEEADSFFANTPRQELAQRAYRVIEEPLLELGLDTAQLKLRSFFTSGAARAVPGQSSLVTPQELVRWLIKLEQGRVVDRWSSQEMKKLIYFTRRRYRYAVSTALDSAAVYFKSGSLYRCRPEPGYECVQYKGNAQNLMHSVAIVESPARGERQRVYLVAMMSDVLKLNSAQVHSQIASQIEQGIRRLNP